MKMKTKQRNNCFTHYDFACVDIHSQYTRRLAKRVKKVYFFWAAYKIKRNFCKSK